MGPDGRFRVSIANNTITALISTAEADCGLLHTAETPFYGWLHLAIAYDGTGGIPDENFAVMYLDGVEISRTQCNGAVLSATQPLNFGKGLDACFDQARFYATAVPYEELLMLQEFDGAYLKTGTVLDVCFSNDNLGVMPPAPAFLDSSASAAEVDMIGGAFIVDTGISGNSVFMEPSEYLVVDSVLTPVFTVEGMGVTFWLNPRFQPNEGDIAYIVRRPDTFRVVLNYETPSGENELCLELMAGDPPSWQTYRECFEFPTGTSGQVDAPRSIRVPAVIEAKATSAIGCREPGVPVPDVHHYLGEWFESTAVNDTKPQVVGLLDSGWLPLRMASLQAHSANVPPVRILRHVDLQWFAHRNVGHRHVETGLNRFAHVDAQTGNNQFLPRRELDGRLPGAYLNPVATADVGEPLYVLLAGDFHRRVEVRRPVCLGSRIVDLLATDAVLELHIRIGDAEGWEDQLEQSLLFGVVGLDLERVFT